VDTQVGPVVLGIDVEIRIGKVDSFDFGAGGHAPTRYVGTGLAPDATRKRRQVRRGTGASPDPVR